MGKMNDARQMIEEIRSKGLQPDVVTYSSLINGLCRMGISEKREVFFWIFLSYAMEGCRKIDERYHVFILCAILGILQ
jgi:hypothetical protein